MSYKRDPDYYNQEDIDKEEKEWIERKNREEEIFQEVVDIKICPDCGKLKVGLKTKIGVCGCKIFDIERFKGSYCDDYCCNHCPEAKVSPCQRERIDGTPMEALYKLQHKGGDKTK
jgi:hypothetical protein